MFHQLCPSHLSWSLLQTCAIILLHQAPAPVMKLSIPPVIVRSFHHLPWINDQSKPQQSNVSHRNKYCMCTTFIIMSKNNKTPIEDETVVDENAKDAKEGESTEGKVKKPNKCRKLCTKENVWRHTQDKIPIVTWLPHYKWKTDFAYDFFAGVTLAFVNVPQGLAFAILANAPLVSGLYTACFSSFVYACLGTVRISSFGPAAVSSLLTGDAVAVYMGSLNMTVAPSDSKEDHNARVTFISTLTFTIGLVYVVFFVLQLSASLVLFTKAFVSGFISGCTIHVLVKSFKLVLGLRIRNKYGYFGVYWNLRELILNIPRTHLPTLYFSLVIIAILLSNTFVFKGLMEKVTKFILPVEGIILVMSVVMSYVLDLHSHGFDIVHHIPAGMPQFSPLDPILFPVVFVHALTVSLINYAITFSMIMATTPGYNKACQDTFAMAAMNLICSNIQCFVSGNSMMRTVVAVNAGIKTQLATILSSLFLIFILLFAGPLFEPLPVAVLGCIILTAIGQLLIQNLVQCPKLFKTSLEDGLIWVAVFTATVILDIKVGLITGFVLTLRQLLIGHIGQKNKEKEMNAKEENNDEIKQENPSNNKLSSPGLDPSI